MIVDVSTDGGVEGEIGLVMLLRGICVKVTDPSLSGEPFEVEIIAADWPPDEGNYENTLGPEVYGHPYDDVQLCYRTDHAVTFVLQDKAVLTYL